MFTRRKLSISVAFVLTLTLLMSLSASAREPALDGIASFRDANAASDSLVIDFSCPPDEIDDFGREVPQPCTLATQLGHGSTYEGWLIDADDNKVSTGRLGRGPYLQGEYVSPSGADLLAGYSTFVITVEPLDDPDPGPSGVIAYGAATRGAVLSHVSVLLGENGVATQLRDQAASALAHAESPMKRSLSLTRRHTLLWQRGCWTASLPRRGKPRQWLATCSSPPRAAMTRTSMALRTISSTRRIT